MKGWGVYEKKGKVHWSDGMSSAFCGVNVTGLNAAHHRDHITCKTCEKLVTRFGCARHGDQKGGENPDPGS